MNVNPITGEVEDEDVLPGTNQALVPLHLDALSEDELLARFPTPVQAAGALLYARAVARRAPAALKKYRTEWKAAQKELTIATALAARDLLTEYPRLPMGERRDLARATDPRTMAASDALDDAWIALEYARDYDRAIGRDIDILRSLNANLRGEHS